MTTDNKIMDEKLQYSINRDGAKISALSCGNIYKYEYFTGKEMLPSNRSQTIEQAKFTYTPLGKVLKKQTEDQVDALWSLNISDKTDELKQIKSVFPQNQMNDFIRGRLKKSLNYEIVTH